MFIERGSSVRCGQMSLDCKTDGFAAGTLLNGAIRPEDIVILNSARLVRKGEYLTESAAAPAPGASPPPAPTPR